MSLQNFPKIPKIILRKPGDQSKDTKNEVQKNVTETKGNPYSLTTHLRSGNDMLIGMQFSFKSSENSFSLRLNKENQEFKSHVF